MAVQSRVQEVAQMGGDDAVVTGEIRFDVARCDASPRKMPAVYGVLSRSDSFPGPGSAEELV